MRKLGTRKQRFIDDTFFDRAENVELTMNPPANGQSTANSDTDGARDPNRAPEIRIRAGQIRIASN